MVKYVAEVVGIHAFSIWFNITHFSLFSKRVGEIEERKTEREEGNGERESEGEREGKGGGEREGHREVTENYVVT